MAVRTPDDVEFEGPHHVGVSVTATWSPNIYRLTWLLITNPYTAVPAWSWSPSAASARIGQSDKGQGFPGAEFGEVLDDAANLSPLLLSLEVAAVADGFARFTAQLQGAPRPEKKLEMRGWQSGLNGILAALAREAGTTIKRMEY